MSGYYRVLLGRGRGSSNQSGEGDDALRDHALIGQWLITEVENLS